MSSEFEGEQFSPTKVRYVEVNDAVVDSAVTGLLMPRRFVEKLGLHTLRNRQEGFDLSFPVRIYGAVVLTIQERDCTIDVGEIGNEFPVIIGRVPLLMLDWVVDPKGERLIGNPEHGGKQMMEVFHT